jgi:hypothetical protein
LALAAGVIIYELDDLYALIRGPGQKHVGMVGLLIGFVLAFATELTFQILKSTM